MQITRRAFVSGSAALTLASHPLLSNAAANADLLLVGTQTETGSSKGIYAYSFDHVTGILTRTALAATTPQPTFLALSPDKHTLYAANETDTFSGEKGGGVSSFALDPSGKLTPISQQPTHGAATCHVAVDHTGTNVFAANYTGGSADSFHISDGNHLSKAVNLLQYTGHGPDASRQESPHAHRVTLSPDNKYLLVNDLGLDQIHVYTLDPATAQLTPADTPTWHAPAGSGPRALIFHPNGNFAYCSCELACSILVLAWDAQAGTLKTTQEFPLPTQPKTDPKADAPTGCDIVLDSKARYAYVANRGDNFIATFALSPDGSRVIFQRRSSCGGTVPRHLTLDPTGRWLLVANQGSDTIAIFARDPQSGYLADAGKTYPISKPQCLLFPQAH